jgi:hypothetical protein
VPTRVLFIPLLLLLLLAAPARAEDLVALYQADWAGMPAADLRLTVHEGADGYRNEMEIRTLGLARWVSKFHGTAAGVGRVVAGHLPAAASFDAHYDLRKRKNRVLGMRFIAAGGATIAERTPDDTSRKPALAAEFRRNVVDPLGALAAIRQQLREHPGAGFTIPVYDGARRFDAIAADPPRHENGTLVLALTLRAIAGFKGESSEDGDPDDAPRPATLTLTDDARLMPLSMTVPIYYLPLTVTLSRWCSAAQPCPW